MTRYLTNPVHGLLFGLAMWGSGCSCETATPLDDGGSRFEDGGHSPNLDAAINGDAVGWGALPDGGCLPVQCQEHTYQCGNCIDDDDDGLADWADPDCLGEPGRVT